MYTYSLRQLAPCPANLTQPCWMPTCLHDTQADLGAEDTLPAAPWSNVSAVWLSVPSQQLFKADSHLLHAKREHCLCAMPLFSPGRMAD